MGAIKRGIKLKLIAFSSPILSLMFLFLMLVSIFTGSSSCDPSSSISDSNTNVSASMEQNAKQVYDYLIKQGASSAGIAGMLGNLEVESGIDPTAVNPGLHGVEHAKEQKINDSNGGAIGMPQYLNGRRNALMTHAQGKSVDWWTVDIQLDYLLNVDGDKQVARRILSMTDVDKASDAWELEYERAGEGEEKLEQRRANAQKWFSKLAGDDVKESDPSFMGGTESADSGISDSNAISKSGCESSSGSTGSAGRMYPDEQGGYWFGDGQYLNGDGGEAHLDGSVVSGIKHDGIDLSPKNDPAGNDIPIYAVEDGIVERLDSEGLPFLMIKFDDGTVLNYMEYKAGSIPSDIQVGSHISKGQEIGKTGPMNPNNDYGGYSTGNHVHFNVSKPGSNFSDWLKMNENENTLPAFEFLNLPNNPKSGSSIDWKDFINEK